MTARIAVVGAGPAGRALTHRLLTAGLPVTLIDRSPHRTWQATYACWTDELPDWLGSDVTSTSVDSVAVVTGALRTLARGYSVLDTRALQRRLTITEAHLVRGQVVDVAGERVRLQDGTTVHADVVIDCRGPLVKGVPRQTAFGVVVDRSAAQPFLHGHQAVLMDWHSSTTSRPSPPSFLYAVPLGDSEYLLEETCLAGYPALTIAELRSRLFERIGGCPAAVRGSERVAFGLVGASQKPWRDLPRTFGARGGLMNPTTGYSVAATLSTVDPLVRAILAGRDPTQVLWPTAARIVYTLRLRGLGALLGLNADETTRFFDAFFRLPVPAQRSYLSGRDDVTGVLRAMALVFGDLGPDLQLRLGRATAMRPAWPGAFPDSADRPPTATLG